MTFNFSSFFNGIGFNQGARRPQNFGNFGSYCDMPPSIMMDGFSPMGDVSGLSALLGGGRSRSENFGFNLDGNGLDFNYNNSQMSQGGLFGMGRGFGCGRPSGFEKTLMDISMLFGGFAAVKRAFAPRKERVESQRTPEDNSLSGQFNSWENRAREAKTNNKTIEPFKIFDHLDPEFKNRYAAALDAYNANKTPENEAKVQKLYLEGMEKFSQDAFNKYDANKNGKVSRNEFIQGELAKTGIDDDTVNKNLASFERQGYSEDEIQAYMQKVQQLRDKKAEMAARKFDSISSLSSKDNAPKNTMTLKDLTAYNAFLDLNSSDGNNDGAIDAKGLTSEKEIEYATPAAKKDVELMQKLYKSFYS